MDYTDLTRKIKTLAAQSPDFVSRVAPHAVAVVAASHFKKNFLDEGFEGQKWPEVQRRMPYFIRNGKTVKNYRKGEARNLRILTGLNPDGEGIGELGRSLMPDHTKSTGGKAVVSAREYGKFHNEGDGVPKRQFMGQTEQLNQLISNELDKQFTKFFSNI